MTVAELAFAFSAGMVASINPCGFAMLPTFITFYLSGDDAQKQVGLDRRLLRAMRIGIGVTAGFLLVFVTMGTVLSAGGRSVVQIAPWLGIVVGISLIGLGLRYLVGQGITVPIPIPQWEFRTRQLRAMFLYGIAYALVSLGCTLPIFLSIVAGSLVADGWLSIGALFLAYSLGMGAVITTLALATALFEGVVVQHFRRLMPRVKLVSALALMAAGGYLVYYQVVLNAIRV